MPQGNLYRLSAFAEDPEGGNPAGVWIGDELPGSEAMQKIGQDVGYSETIFVAPSSGFKRVVRYFSPEAEVSFCGHATIAAAVHLGREHGNGVYNLDTAVGLVSVETQEQEGKIVASLHSVEPRSKSATQELLERALTQLGWSANDLDPLITPSCSYAGAWHLILATRSKDRLNRLNYDFEGLKKLMLEYNLTTLQLIWRESPLVFHSRNPFPVGGVVEDPATGAAAAALGGYLRSSAHVEVPASFVIYQGEAMGRPSILNVSVPSEGGIIVSGTAVPIE